jgi:hypothetical protein
VEVWWKKMLTGQEFNYLLLKLIGKGDSLDWARDQRMWIRGRTIDPPSEGKLSIKLLKQRIFARTAKSTDHVDDHF